MRRLMRYLQDYSQWRWCPAKKQIFIASQISSAQYPYQNSVLRECEIQALCNLTRSPDNVMHKILEQMQNK
jgi:hypothetical protein